jgi:hypothetical protein
MYLHGLDFHYTTIIELYGTMFIVLSNRQEGKDMPDHHDMETAPTPAEHEDVKAQHGPSASQLAAVVEAAYILEAVRK